MENRLQETVVVTVLMTVYNGAKYLPLTLKSLLSQSYRDFELLIINDCSTDESMFIVESIKDSRIRVHHNEKNIGQTQSLNVGLLMAKGKWIARMDADDFAFPLWLEKQVECCERYPDYAVISCQAVAMDENNQIFKKLRTPSNHQDILVHSMFGSPINHVGSLFQKDTIQAMGGYPSEYKLAADYALWSKLLLQGHSMMTNPVIGVAIRYHTQSISRVEHHVLGKKEISKVMLSNINALSAVQCSQPDAEMIWDMCFDSDTMNGDDFLWGCRKIKSVFQSFRVEKCRISVSQAERIARNFLKIVVFKKIMALASKDDGAGLKELAEKAGEILGGMNLVWGVLFWFLRLGKWTREPTVIIYEQIRWIQAKTAIRGVKLHASNF